MMSYSQKYTLYGSAFGLFFPLIATFLDAWLSAGHISYEALVHAQLTKPMIWMIDTAPFFLGLFARFGGIQYDNLNASQAKERTLNQLLESKNKELEDKVLERTCELEENIDQLVTANQVRSEFIATVSHELRTPLTAISGSIKLIKSGVIGEVEGKVLDLIETADKNADHLKDLINDILDLEKIEAGELQFSMKDYSLLGLMNNVMSMSKPFSDSFKVNLMLTSFDKQIKINIDKRRYLQIVLNLVSNACKFSPAGSEVTLSIEHFDKIVRLSVIDVGVGIPENMVDEVFEKFTQVDSSVVRSRGGTGLGLNICKSLTESMGGKIGFYPNKSQGTVFFVEFEEG